MKNKELKEQLNSLTRLNKVQSQYIKNYDKENQISNKMDILKKEVQQTKDAIKEYQTKYNKLDKFIKLIHEKIISVEMLIKKDKTNKEEPKKKIFTKEELKDTIELITNLKNQITEKRNQLNMITKQNDTRINKMIAQNKQIEVDYKESEKLNKILIFKRNELKRNIKNITVNGVNTNKNKYKLNNVNNNKGNNNNEVMENNNEENMNLEKELDNDAEFNEPNNIENNNDNINNDENYGEEQHKLFEKNPNKKIEINNEEEQNVNDENENLEEEDNDAIEKDNINYNNNSLDKGDE